MEGLYSKIAKRITTFFHKMKRFGFRIAFWDLLDSQKHRIRIFYDTINKNKHNAVISWLSKNFGNYISEYTKCMKPAQPQLPIPKQIWICWWDGIDTMPPLVKACYNSVLQYASDYKVTVITKDNFSNYISIPDHVLQKVNNKVMTVTHFSNIIRMSLLDKYGGLWLDATILITGAIDLNNMSFFTMRGEFGGEDVPRRRWTGNCIGGMPKLLLFNFIREFLCAYWKEYDEMPDYFLYDYSIAFAYKSIPEIKEIIDNVPSNSKNCIKSYMFLQDHLGDEYNPVFFDEAARNAVFHKLTWKQGYPVRTPEERLTLYGYILEKYLK